MDKPRFCGQCGAQLEPRARFCGKCGGQAVSPWDAPAASSAPQPVPVSAAPVREPVPAPVAAAPQAAPSAELVLGFIPGATRRKGLLGSQMFSIVVTRDRLVFALVSNKVRNDAVAELNARAKAAGKGVLGRVAAQFGYMHLIAQRAAGLPIAELLSQNKENFFIPISTISKVRIEDDSDFDEGGSSYEKLKIESVSGKFEFTVPYGAGDEARKVLRSAIGAAVR